MPSRAPGGYGLAEGDSLLHFREEEEILFPLVIDRADAPIELLSRLLLEHVRMHRLVGKLRAEIDGERPPPRRCARSASSSPRTSRGRRGSSSPLMERVVSEEDLRSIRLAPRKRTPPPR